jgi:hypothetical protein
MLPFKLISSLFYIFIISSFNLRFWSIMSIFCLHSERIYSFYSFSSDIIFFIASSVYILYSFSICSLSCYSNSLWIFDRIFFSKISFWFSKFYWLFSILFSANSLFEFTIILSFSLFSSMIPKCGDSAKDSFKILSWKLP